MAFLVTQPPPQPPRGYLAHVAQSGRLEAESKRSLRFMTSLEPSAQHPGSPRGVCSGMSSTGNKLFTSSQSSMACQRTLFHSNNRSNCLPIRHHCQGADSIQHPPESGPGRVVEEDDGVELFSRDADEVCIEVDNHGDDDDESRECHRVPTKSCLSNQQRLRQRKRRKRRYAQMFSKSQHRRSLGHHRFSSDNEEDALDTSRLHTLAITEKLLHPGEATTSPCPPWPPASAVSVAFDEGNEGASPSLLQQPAETRSSKAVVVLANLAPRQRSEMEWTPSTTTTTATGRIQSGKMDDGGGGRGSVRGEPALTGSIGLLAASTPANGSSGGCGNVSTAPSTSSRLCVTHSPSSKENHPIFLHSLNNHHHLGRNVWKSPAVHEAPSHLASPTVPDDELSCLLDNYLDDSIATQCFVSQPQSHSSRKFESHPTLSPQGSRARGPSAKNDSIFLGPFESAESPSLEIQEQHLVPKTTTRHTLPSAASGGEACMKEFACENRPQTIKTKVFQASKPETSCLKGGTISNEGFSAQSPEELGLIRSSNPLEETPISDLQAIDVSPLSHNSIDSGYEGPVDSPFAASSPWHPHGLAATPAMASFNPTTTDTPPDLFHQTHPAAFPEHLSGFECQNEDDISDLVDQVLNSIASEQEVVVASRPTDFEHFASHPSDDLMLVPPPPPPTTSSESSQEQQLGPIHSYDANGTKFLAKATSSSSPMSATTSSSSSSTSYSSSASSPPFGECQQCKSSSLILTSSQSSSMTSEAHPGNSGSQQCSCQLRSSSTRTNGNQSSSAGMAARNLSTEKSNLHQGPGGAEGGGQDECFSSAQADKQGVPDSMVCQGQHQAQDKSSSSAETHASSPSPSVFGSLTSGESQYWNSGSSSNRGPSGGVPVESRGSLGIPPHWDVGPVGVPNQVKRPRTVGVVEPIRVLKEDNQGFKKPSRAVAPNNGRSKLGLRPRQRKNIPPEQVSSEEIFTQTPSSTSSVFPIAMDETNFFKVGNEPCNEIYQLTQQENRGIERRGRRRRGSQHNLEGESNPRGDELPLEQHGKRAGDEAELVGRYRITKKLPFYFKQAIRLQQRRSTGMGHCEKSFPDFDYSSTTPGSNSSCTEEDDELEGQPPVKWRIRDNASREKLSNTTTSTTPPTRMSREPEGLSTYSAEATNQMRNDMAQKTRHNSNESSSSLHRPQVSRAHQMLPRLNGGDRISKKRTSRQQPQQRVYEQHPGEAPEASSSSSPGSADDDDDDEDGPGSGGSSGALDDDDLASSGRGMKLRSTGNLRRGKHSMAGHSSHPVTGAVELEHRRPKKTASKPEGQSSATRRRWRRPMGDDVGRRQPPSYTANGSEGDEIRDVEVARSVQGKVKVDKYGNRIRYHSSRPRVAEGGSCGRRPANAPPASSSTSSSSTNITSSTTTSTESRITQRRRHKDGIRLEPESQKTSRSIPRPLTGRPSQEGTRGGNNEDLESGPCHQWRQNSINSITIHSPSSLSRSLSDQNTKHAECALEGMGEGVMASGYPQEVSHHPPMARSVKGRKRKSGRRASPASTRDFSGGFGTQLESEVNDGSTDNNNPNGVDEFTNKSITSAQKLVHGREAARSNVMAVPDNDPNEDWRLSRAAGLPSMPSNVKPEAERSLPPNEVTRRPPPSRPLVLINSEEDEDSRHFTVVSPDLRTSFTHGSDVKWLYCSEHGCTFWTRKPQRMIRHTKCHVPDARYYRCPDCSSKFYSLAKLLKHDRKVHTGMKDYECRVCEAEVTDIVVHMKVHKTEKDFICNVCHMSFRHKNSLIRHMCQHTGERPNRCVQCEAAFVSLNRLKDHIRKAHPNSVAAQGLNDMHVKGATRLMTNPESEDEVIQETLSAVAAIKRDMRQSKPLEERRSERRSPQMVTKSEPIEIEIIDEGTFGRGANGSHYGGLPSMAAVPQPMNSFPMMSLLTGANGQLFLVPSQPNGVQTLTLGHHQASLMSNNIPTASQSGHQSTTILLPSANIDTTPSSTTGPTPNGGPGLNWPPSQTVLLAPPGNFLPPMATSNVQFEKSFGHFPDHQISPHQPHHPNLFSPYPTGLAQEGGEAVGLAGGRTSRSPPHPFLLSTPDECQTLVASNEVVTLRNDALHEVVTTLDLLATSGPEYDKRNGMASSVFDLEGIDLDQTPNILLPSTPATSSSSPSLWPSKSVVNGGCNNSWPHQDIVASALKSSHIVSEPHSSGSKSEPQYGCQGCGRQYKYENFLKSHQRFCQKIAK